MPDSATFDISIECGSPPPKGRDTPIRFWSEYIQNLDEVRVPMRFRQIGESHNSILESRIQLRFAFELRRLLNEYYPASKGGKFAFALQKLSYNSLELSMIVTGLKALADAFDHDPNLFMMALAACTPPALITSLDLPDAVYRELTTNVTMGNDIRDAFRGPAPDSATATLDWRRVAAMYLTNSSLLIPTVIAVAVMYFISEGIREDRKTLGELQKAVLQHSEQQMKILADQATHSRELEQALAAAALDSVKSQRGSGSGEKAIATKR